MAQRKSQIAKDILRRVRWLYVVFLVVALAIIGRVAWIQYGPDADALKSKAQKITFEQVSLTATRGDILSSDGRVMATSIPMYSIHMDFAANGLTDTVFKANVDSLALKLAGFFKDKSAARYKDMMVAARKEALDDPDKKTNRFKLISPRRVDVLEEKEISGFPIFRLGANKGGYSTNRIEKRIHPLGSLASRTIGRYVSDSVKYGIEGSFNNQLKGTDGRVMMQRISGSFRVPVPDPANLEPVNGMNVVTTIDVDIQDVAETALKQQLEAGNADWGTVILMEVATGEVHALCNITRKRPGVFEEDYNYAIGRRIEPGSTFKLATLITLLEDGKMPLSHEINCNNGEDWVGQKTKKHVVDSHREGRISLKRVFEVSSNVGFAKAVNDTYGTEPERFVNFVSNMGFGRPLGIAIPGERPPLIKQPGSKNWDGTSLVMMSYGYALEITPMHTAALYNAVANGGKMLRPRVVKEVQNYGKTVHEFKTEVINPAICSPQTIAQVRECLEGVVDEGTGTMLKNPYYTVAAKTGTAQVALDNGGYNDPRGGKHYLATMVGYFPADNPRYTCLVAIKVYGPNAKISYYGGGLSGPVFKAISDRVYAANTAWHEPVDTDGPKALLTAGDLKNGRSEELKKLAGRLSVPVRIDRETKELAYVDAAAGDDLGADRAADTTGGTPLRFINISSADAVDDTVPSVIGMGLKDALYVLESQGLTVAFSGLGKVVSQSIAPGTPLEKGKIIVLAMGT